MKRVVLAGACLIGIFIAGCDSSSSTTTSSSKFSGPATATKTDTPGPTLEGQAGSNTGVLLPSGAPPEAIKTMQGTMGGASAMPKGGGGFGSGSPGGAPSATGTPK